MSQIKAFLFVLWNLTILCKFCLTALPQKPENISCIYYYNDTLNCSWSSGREIPNGTNCSVVIRSDEKSEAHVKDGRMKNGSCIVEHIPSNFYVTQLKVQLFEEAFNLTPQRARDVLKPGPPEIVKVEGMKEMLRVDLRKKEEEPSYDPFICEIWYEATTKNISAYEPVRIEEFERNQSLNLTGLWNFTNYTVAVRCKGDGFGNWSEWSNKVTKRTEEQAPLKVDLWRVIETCPKGNRNVHLLWKIHKEFPSSGIITGYTVKYIAGRINVEKKYNQNEPVILNLTKDAYNISFTAHNSAGDSPEATIRIPSKHEETIDQKRITRLNASAFEEQIVLTWDSTNSEISGYIIEWHDELEKGANKRSWHRITNITGWTFPKGNFQKYRCYNFSVYPLCKDEIKKPTSTSIYFHESVPLIGPQAEVEKTDKDYAVITWKEIPEAERKGVIINYTIIYKEGNKRVVEKTVDSSILTYTLQPLQPNTNYRAWIMANTSIGGTKGNEIYFLTKLLSTTDIILATVFIGIFMTCFVSFGLLWALKYKMIKRICWPQIPHPVITSCPALSQQKIILGNSSSEDDINILKMDTCRENKLPLLFPENCFKPANVTAKLTVADQETFCTGEYKALECFLPASSLNHDFHNQPLLTRRRDSENSAKEEMQYQKNVQEKTEFNSYLKNSVCSREFVDYEDVEQNTKKPETQPVFLACCNAGDPYVAPDTVKLLSRR